VDTAAHVAKAWGFISTPLEAFLYLACLALVAALAAIWLYMGAQIKGRDASIARRDEAIAKRDEAIAALQEKRLQDVRDLHHSTTASLGATKETIAALHSSVDRLRDALERAPRGRTS
jgi:septal ring factor EnvC (AmiA/AmiB activator)